MFKKYKWNFVFLVLGVSVLGFFIFDLIFYREIKSYLYNQTLDEMRMKTQLAVRLLERGNFPPLVEDNANLNDITQQIRTIVNSRVTIIDSSGQVLADSDVAPERIHLMDNHLHRPEIKKALAEGWGQSYRRSDTVGRNIFYTAFPIKRDQKILAILRLAYYAQNFEESMSNIIPMIIGGNLLGLLILFVASLYLGHVVTAPILKIVDIAKRIAAGDLDRNFPRGRTDELGQLALILEQLTERLKNQIALISNERSKLQDILTNLDAGVIVLDQHKNIIHVNPRVFEMLSLSGEGAGHQNVLELIRDEQLLAAIDLSLQQGQKITGEIERFIQHQKTFVSYIVTPFLPTAPQAPGALIQFYDISTIKKLEAIRKDFVANASHELKTPLTAIVGYTETLLEGAAEKASERIKFLRRIREQAQRLEFLISDLLKLSELEREQPIELKPVELVALIHEITDDFKAAANQKNISLTIEAPETLQALINEEGFRSVLNNLLDNAIKYTLENGKIIVRVTEGGTGNVKIEVIDNGIGIDPKYHERIFQRFYRIDKARSRSLGGSGLGLAIVKHIVERHGSKIYLDSDLGKGSTFWFELKKAES
ncbi:MAG: ATP-binding protein [candidate division KSB1 bacterium]|nr:ATP-binding protein [candidate division KSB1 bacterium]MDZ7318819.1 ATP-binding protein [candidate division KSB1 bacterium]MDZ7342348.1 ATP-binding protein [candidate division KSB1 bacterium]